MTPFQLELMAPTAAMVESVAVAVQEARVATPVCLLARAALAPMAVAVLVAAAVQLVWPGAVDMVLWVIQSRATAVMAVMVETQVQRVLAEWGGRQAPVEPVAYPVRQVLRASEFPVQRVMVVTVVLVTVPFWLVCQVAMEVLAAMAAPWAMVALVVLAVRVS